MNIGRTGDGALGWMAVGAVAALCVMSIVSAPSSAEALSKPFATQDSLSFSHAVSHRRALAASTTLPHARAACLYAWRVGNLGLPTLPPLLWDQGAAATGVGLVVARVPPLFLQEGIVGHEYEYDDGRSTVNEKDDDEENNDNKNPTGIVLQYKVLNPGYLTWPVQNHLGTIRFFTTQEQESADNDAPSVVIMAEWSIQWTPLWMPIPYWDQILTQIHQTVIETALDYIATLDPQVVASYNDKNNRQPEEDL